jgi:formiminoglutamate deiminase
VRYSDGDAAAWAERVGDLDALDRHGGAVVVGAAIHSVRAVPADQMETVRDWASDVPLHVHLSEQVAENRACVAEYARTPTEVLADHGLLGPRTTAVHATHLTEDDVRLLGTSGTYAGFCPTTERDLGDGIGPSRALHDAGCRLTLGSDSHAVIDPFEEMRAVELDERLATQERGHWSAAELLAAATVHGHASLGFADAGEIAVGQRADLVTVDTSSPRTAGAGADENAAVFAATAEDVRQVVVDGRVVFRQGEREQVGRELDAAIRRVREGVS